MGWRFYVYRLIAHCGAVVYVGKGSGSRLATQKRRHGLDGCEVARFKREADAYAFERQQIAELQPALNRCAGGNGGISKPKRPNWLFVMEKIGTRAYAARLLLAVWRSKPELLDASKLDLIRLVAHGAR